AERVESRRRASLATGGTVLFVNKKNQKNFRRMLTHPQATGSPTLLFAHKRALSNLKPPSGRAGPACPRRAMSRHGQITHGNLSPNLKKIPTPKTVQTPAEATPATTKVPVDGYRPALHIP
ncbi:hypothetical protein, partial [uncultured Rikenella sp.]